MISTIFICFSSLMITNPINLQNNLKKFLYAVIYRKPFKHPCDKQELDFSHSISNLNEDMQKSLTKSLIQSKLLNENSLEKLQHQVT